MCVCLPCHKKQQVAFQRGALKMPENEEAFSGERCSMTCAVELSARWPRLQAAVEAGDSLRFHGLVPCSLLRPGTAWAAGQRLELCIKTRTTCRCAVSLASFFLVFPVLFPFRSAPFLWLLLLPCSVSGVRHIALDLQRRRRRGNEGEMIGETPGDSSITRPRPAQRHFSAAIHPRTCPSLERALWNKMS